MIQELATGGILSRPNPESPGGSVAGYAGAVLSNQIVGGYGKHGDSLAFGDGASTMMACPPPLDSMEWRLRDVLAATRSFRLEGRTLLLRDAEGGATATPEHRRRIAVRLDIKPHIMQ